MQDEKYEAPALQVLGTVEELTAGQSRGQFTDRQFPTNTPFNQLTFSR